MSADDTIAAELAAIRERSEAYRDPAHMDLYRAGCAIKSADDVPRLLVMVDALLTPHSPRTDRVLGTACGKHRLMVPTLLPLADCGECTQHSQREVCPECRDEYGDPVPFADCRAHAAAGAALTGEEKADG